jgi:hypothetical protein
MENIVLEHLRHIRATVDGIAADLRRTNAHVSALEFGHGSMAVSHADQNVEIDRLKERLDRVERRLDLRD